MTARFQFDVPSRPALPSDWGVTDPIARRVMATAFAVFEIEIDQLATTLGRLAAAEAFVLTAASLAMSDGHGHCPDCRAPSADIVRQTVEAMLDDPAEREVAGFFAANVMTAAHTMREWYWFAMLCRPTAEAVHLEEALEIARTMSLADFIEVGRLIAPMAALRPDLIEWWDAVLAEEPALRVKL